MGIVLSIIIIVAISSILIFLFWKFQKSVSTKQKEDTSSIKQKEDTSSIKEKYLFLDVDGVLNVSTGSTFSPFIDSKFELLKKIIDNTGALIVVSSFWRTIDFQLEMLKNKLSEYGLHFIDITPNFNEMWYKTKDRKYLVERGFEILAWLEENNKLKNSNFVAIDDQPLILYYKNSSNKIPQMIGHTVLTDQKIGLQEHNVNQAIEILNRV